MSLLSSHLSIARQHAAEVVGVDVECKRPADVDYITVSGVVLGNEKAEQRQGDSGIEYVKSRSILVAISKLPGSAPRLDLQWKLAGGVRYATEDFDVADGGHVSLTLRRLESHEVSRKGYRGRR